MSDPNTLVSRLILLATDPAATEEEARTAAFQAVRLIRQHNMLGRQAPRQSAPKPPPYSPPPPKPPPPTRKGRFMRSRFSGICTWCHRSFNANEAIYWHGPGAGSDHAVPCARERLQAEDPQSDQPF